MNFLFLFLFVVLGEEKKNGRFLHAHEFAAAFYAVIRVKTRCTQREATTRATPRVGTAGAAADAIRRDLLDMVTIWTGALDRRAAVVARVVELGVGCVLPDVVTTPKGERIDARAGHGAQLTGNAKGGEAVSRWHEIQEARHVVPFLGGFHSVAFSARDPGSVHLLVFSMGAGFFFCRFNEYRIKKKKVFEIKIFWSLFSVRIRHHSVGNSPRRRANSRSNTQHHTKHRTIHRECTAGHLFRRRGSSRKN